MAAGQWSDQEKDILAYSLKYFEIHAAQRMSVFNFFIVLSTIILTGLATCVFGDEMYVPIGVPLGLLLTALALTFWKLDQRTSFLVKRAEKALEHLETVHFPAFAQIISNEPKEFENLNDTLSFYRKHWTYSRSLGLVFLVVGIMGVAGTVLAGSKASGIVDWFDKAEHRANRSFNVEIVQPQSEKALAQAPVPPEDKKEKTRSGGPAHTPH